MYGACCSAQTAHKPVQQSRQTVLRASCPIKYTMPKGVQSTEKMLVNGTDLTAIGELG